MSAAIYQAMTAAPQGARVSAQGVWGIDARTSMRAARHPDTLQSRATPRPET